MEASEALNGYSASAAGRVEAARPAQLWAETVEPVVVAGWAFQRRHATADIWADIGASRLPAAAIGIERQDVYELFRPTAGRSAHARWSGYVLAGVVDPLPAGEHPWRLSMTLDTGEEVPVEQRRVLVRTFDRIPVDLPELPEVAVAMATFNPDPALFAAQISSIRSQTHGSWACIVCDDCSSAALQGRDA